MPDVQLHTFHAVIEFGHIPQRDLLAFKEMHKNVHLKTICEEVKALTEG